MPARPFAVFDIDGTLIRWQLYHAIANQLAKHGHFSPEARQTISNSRMAWKRREHGESFKDYERELVHAYDKLLKELTIDEFELAATEVFDEYKDQAYAYTRDLIKRLKNEGYLLFAISGSQIEIVAKIAAYYGFDDYIGSVYGRKGNGFDGTKIFGAKDKQIALGSMVDKHLATKAGSVAVGDSESDIAMLEVVERPIAFNPEKKLFDHAKQNGWGIIVERKNVIYELSKTSDGYRLG